MNRGGASTKEAGAAPARETGVGASGARSGEARCAAAAPGPSLAAIHKERLDAIFKKAGEAASSGTGTCAAEIESERGAGGEGEEEEHSHAHDGARTPTR